MVLSVNDGHLDHPEMHRTGLLGPLVQQIRAGGVTAEELVAESLRRIAGAADLNAVTVLRADDAMAEARAIDRRRAGGEHLPELAGLPTLVKDNADVTGMVTTHGSLLHRHDAPAESNDSVVQHLRAAGAVVIGKTNLPEFAMESFTDNRLYGPTHNPWRSGMTPGGSSGGSAAALIAGLASIATGTDGGGSTRIPAALCGLVGLKPTSGVAGSRAARLPIDLSSTAPLAVTAADLALLAKHLLRPAAGDPSAVYGPPPHVPGRRPRRIVATYRIAGNDAVTPDVAAAFDAVVDSMGEALGQPVERLAPPLPAEADDHWADVYAAEDSWSLGWERARAHRDLLDERIAPWVDRGQETSLQTYLTARDARQRYVRVLDDLLAGDVLMITPTLTVAGLPVDGRIELPDGEPVPINLFNTAALNFTGHPAVSVPAGYIDGMPFGVQLVGARGSDLWLIEQAGIWEQEQPWPLAAPGHGPLTTSAPTKQNEE